MSLTTKCIIWDTWTSSYLRTIAVIPNTMSTGAMESVSMFPLPTGFFSQSNSPTLAFLYIIEVGCASEESRSHQLCVRREHQFENSFLHQRRTFGLEISQYFVSGPAVQAAILWLIQPFLPMATILSWWLLLFSEFQKCLQVRDPWINKLWSVYLRNGGAIGLSN